MHIKPPSFSAHPLALTLASTANGAPRCDRILSHFKLSRNITATAKVCLECVYTNCYHNNKGIWSSKHLFVFLIHWIIQHSVIRTLFPSCDIQINDVVLIWEKRIAMKQVYGLPKASLTYRATRRYCSGAIFLPAGVTFPPGVCLRSGSTAQQPRFSYSRIIWKSLHLHLLSPCRLQKYSCPSQHSKRMITTSNR